jgi:hypothetical protein
MSGTAADLAVTETRECQDNFHFGCDGSHWCSSKRHTKKQLSLLKARVVLFVSGTTGRLASITSSMPSPSKTGARSVAGFIGGYQVEFDGTYGGMVLLREQKGGHYEIAWKRAEITRSLSAQLTTSRPVSPGGKNKKAG